MIKLKTFDLEAAKRGDLVITRNGCRVLAIHHFAMDKSNYPVVAVIEHNEKLSGSCTFTTRGLFHEGAESKFDLFMAPTKRKFFVNLYPQDNPLCEGKGSFAVWYEDEESARRSSDISAIATAVLIEIEV